MALASFFRSRSTRLAFMTARRDAHTQAPVAHLLSRPVQVPGKSGYNGRARFVTR